MDNITISTLGPKGTCSEYASNHYIDKKGLNAKVNLHATFEDAIHSLKNEESDLVIIPSAYQKLAEIMFSNHNTIELDYTFSLKTPVLILASKEKLDNVQSIAVHASPIHMLKLYFPHAYYTAAGSNADAAKQLMSGCVDACVTTDICAKKYNLNVIKHFGDINMSWNVFRKIN